MIHQVIDIVGGQTKLAAICGVTPQAVHKWVNADRVPADKVLVIEGAVGGQITRYQLRPDVFGEAPAELA